MEPKLVYPTYTHQETVKEFFTAMKKADSESVNGIGMYESYLDDFEGWIKREKQFHLGINLETGFVPGTTFLYATKDEVIGTTNIRHCLNDSLLKMGGHIGYSVHPKYRQKGYATKMLQETLGFCKRWEIWPVLITCYKTNIASRKTIEKCGGKLENEYYDEKTKETVLRFWIGEKDDRF